MMRNLILFYYLLVTSSIFAQDWQESYGNALAVAKQEDKSLILVFSRSDWCSPRIKLDKQIWQSVEFNEFSGKNYVLRKADFSQKKANKLPKALMMENNGLAEKYNPQGYFPLVVVLDKNGAILGKAGYFKSSPSEYIGHLNTFLK